MCYRCRSEGSNGCPCERALSAYEFHTLTLDKKEAFEAEEDDPLINPAHALVGAHAKEKEMAEAFVVWLASSEGGQRLIKDFAANDRVLYSVAPEGVDPLHMPSKFSK